MTARRFLELLPLIGADLYRAADGHLVLVASDGVLAALRPQLCLIGREPIEQAFRDLEAESAGRVRLAQASGR